MSVIDCLSYNGEIDVLKVRLAEMHELVDTVVIVECPYTFSGNKKELRFPEDKKQLEDKYLNKIKYVVFDENDPNDDAWEREFKQKNSIFYRGVAKLMLFDDDYVVYSDLDEIPDSTTIRKYILAKSVSTVFQPHWFNFNIENYLGPWPGHTIWLYRYADMRQWLWFKGEEANIHNFPAKKAYPESGWHLSYFMPPEEILNKLSSYSHFNDLKDLYVKEQGIGYIKNKIKAGGCLFNKFEKKVFSHPLPLYYVRQEQTS